MRVSARSSTIVTYPFTRPSLCSPPTINSEKTMATYECEKCGMKVNATCGHCGAPLENSTLELPDGKKVQISQCPNGHGKIKSPLCCGQDMSCSIG